MLSILHPLSTMTTTTILTPPPPTLPPAWLWSCHICHTNYPLGATRRCLIDGHRFCAGTVTTNKRTGRSRRSTPCGSVFDYVGWRAYGDWRRTEARARTRAAITAAAGRIASSTATASAPPLAEATTFRPGAIRRSSALRPAVPSPLSKLSTHDDDDGSTGPTSSFPPPSPLAGAHSPRRRDCSRDCDYPSECRWRPHLAASGAAGGPATPTMLPSVPPSPTSPTDPSSPLAAALLQEGFPGRDGDGSDDSASDEERDGEGAGMEMDADGDDEIQDVIGAIESRTGSGDLTMPSFVGMEAAGDIGLAVSTEKYVGSEGSAAKEDADGERTESPDQALGLGFNPKLWDWSIGGLSNLNGFGSGMAGEMDGGVR